jgi:hypothetical protein
MMNDPCALCSRPGVDRVCGHDLCRGCTDAPGDAMARRLGFTLREERFESEVIRRVRSGGQSRDVKVTLCHLRVSVHHPHAVDARGSFTAEPERPLLWLPAWLQPRRVSTDVEVGEPSFDDVVHVRSDAPDPLRLALADEAIQTAITEMIYDGKVQLEPGVVIAEIWREGVAPDGEKMTREAVLLALHLDRAGRLN